MWTLGMKNQTKKITLCCGFRTSLWVKGDCLTYLLLFWLLCHTNKFMTSLSYIVLQLFVQTDSINTQYQRSALMLLWQWINMFRLLDRIPAVAKLVQPVFIQLTFAVVPNRHFAPHLDNVTAVQVLVASDILPHCAVTSRQQLLRGSFEVSKFINVS